LFGFGFYVQLRRAEERGIAFKKIFSDPDAIAFDDRLYPRLLFYGLVILSGTTLFVVCWLLLVYKWSPKKILITGLLFAVLGTAIVFILNGVIGVSYTFDTSIVNEHPVTTSYWRYLQINARIDPSEILSRIHHYPRICIWLHAGWICNGQIRLFSRAEKFRKTTKRLIGLGLLFGLVCSYLFWMISIGKLELTPALIWFTSSHSCRFVFAKFCLTYLFL
jgi:hypothetical protein